MEVDATCSSQDRLIVRGHCVQHCDTVMLLVVTGAETGLDWMRG